MFGYIYITTNKVNHKRYIGKHSGLFDEQYLGSGNLLLRAIKKYGRHNFSVKVLLKCKDIISLNKKEKEVIELYAACEDPFYYNIAKGGNGGDVTAGYTKNEYDEFCRKSNIWEHIDFDSDKGRAIRKKYSNKKERNGMYGKKRDDLKQLVIGRNKTKTKCIYCKKEANLGNIARWHNENCTNKNFELY